MNRVLETLMDRFDHDHPGCWKFARADAENSYRRTIDALVDAGFTVSNTQALTLVVGNSLQEFDAAVCWRCHGPVDAPALSGPPDCGTHAL